MTNAILPINQRELSYYTLFATLALFLMAMAASTVWYLLPDDPPSSVYTAGAFEQYPPSDTPYLIQEGNIWLVNIDGWLVAYPRLLTQPNGGRCNYSWNMANNRFEDPCSGAAFRLDGVALRRPIQNDLSQYVVTVQRGDVLINTDQVQLGACRQLPNGHRSNYPSWGEADVPPHC